ncbi:MULTISPECIES: site-specific DNA-methyltransferase [unclassified Gilvimarinus]|uniref:site-specific DNA-methyltransferase n=1 Tax=Gilvimarinus sp. DZF01 TaxID=3461371 RepID=UPI004045CC50
METLDFERLKAELGEFSEIYDNRRERYGMDWPGKRDCLRLIQQPSTATLKPCREESVDFDSTENLFIEGDNLEVLKLLQKSYYGKVKMIYIDPPYNTGKEFIYPDNYTESLDTYLQYAGLKDREGRTFSTNSANEGRFHTKWLNMMYPRLYLARNLLREDGVIFISIDDNEVENLRRMCDEIFGEENLIECFVWKKSYGGGPKEKYAVTQHEYCLLYARNKEMINEFSLPYDEEKIRRYYKYKDDNHELRGPYRLKPLEATKSMDARPNLVYGIPSPDGEDIFPKRQWLWSKERVLKALDNNELQIIDGQDGKTVNYKQYLRDEDGVERGEKPFSVIDGIYTQHGTNDLRALFDDEVVVQFPKPVELISKFIEIACHGEVRPIVLDFFAGSGTTAESCFKVSAKHRQKIHFVLVQLPEQCESGSKAYEMGCRAISEVSLKRIHRASDRVRRELDSQLDFGSIDHVDLGCKVLKLNQSNFKQWQAPSVDISDEDLLQQMELNVDHIAPNASQEDLLYELLIKSGIMPTKKIEQIELAGHGLYSVDEGELLVHLEGAIDQALVDAVLARNPQQFICLDRAFHGNDPLKANVVKTFATYNRDREGLDRIEFRTV